MRHSRAEVRLRDAMDRMRARLGSRPLGDPVESLEDSLQVLYEIEEYHRRALAPNYYTTRDSSPDGRALAGLVYARGLVTHGQAETAHLVTWPIVHQAAGSGVGRSRIYSPVATYQWKKLAELPPPDKPERWGRDALYEQHVEGRGLVEPFDASLVFLATLPP